MSNCRSILLLLALVVALAGINLYSARWGGDRRANSRITLVDSAAKVSAFSISRANGETVRLERRGGSWQMIEPFESGVDERVVMKAIDMVSFARISDVMSESELLRLGRTRADFRLDNPVMTLDVEMDGKSETFGFGEPTPAGDGVYVSVAGVSAVYVVPSDVLAAVDQPADSFRLKSLVRTGPDAVRAFAVKSGGGQPEQFDRTAEGWSASSGKASVKRIDDFLAALTAAEAVGFVWPVVGTNRSDRSLPQSTPTAAKMAMYGLDPETAITVTLKCIDGRDRQVSFGKRTDEGLVYALVHGGTAVVTARAELRDALAGDKKLFADSRLFPMEYAAVSAFTLVDGNETCTLARNAAGIWMLESPVSAPADQVTAEAALKKILALMPSDLDENGITVSLPSGFEPAKVSSASLLGGSGFAAFRSREVLRIDPQLVKRLSSIPHGASAPNQAVVYSRELKTWNVEIPDGGEVVAESLQAVLSALSPLHAERVERLKADSASIDDYGLDRPYLTIAIDPVTEEAVRRNLIIGAVAAGGGRYATVGSSDSVFVISDSAVSTLAASFVRNSNALK